MVNNNNMVNNEDSDRSKKLKLKLKSKKLELKKLILSEYNYDNQLPILEVIITYMSEVEKTYNQYCDSLYYLSSTPDEINLNNLNVTKKILDNLKGLSMTYNQTILDNWNEINRIVETCQTKAAPLIKEIQLLEDEIENEERNDGM